MDRFAFENRCARCLILLVGAFILGWHAHTQAAQSLTLMWLPSSSPGVVGYNIYYGQASGRYTTMIQIGGTSATISGLDEGQTYYFVVTAVDVLGFESGPSAELPYYVSYPDVALRMRRVTMGGSTTALALTSTNSISCRWTLQGTEDFRTWKTMCSGSNCPVNTVVVVSGAQKLFFRLKKK